MTRWRRRRRRWNTNNIALNSMAWRNARKDPPPLGAAGWIISKSLSVLLCLFNILSSSSSLPFPSIFCFSFCLQFFASFLAVLEVFFSPPLSSPRLAHSAGPIGLDLFFLFFCIFLLYIFLFFRLAFLSIFDAFWLAWKPPNQAKFGKNLLRKTFFWLFSFLCQLLTDFYRFFSFFASDGGSFFM